MTGIMQLETERLILRQWQDTDFPVFAGISADPEVMRYYPKPLTKEQSEQFANKHRVLIQKQGWGFWALQLREHSRFIGFAGLNVPTYQLPVSPCMEIGWWLGRKYWGQGYATEAARAALDVAFNRLRQQVVYAFTSVGNARSRAVMERIGMRDTQQNFEHPMIPESHPLREHVLYMIERNDQDRYDELAVTLVTREV